MFDLDDLRAALVAHARVARVVVAKVQGSGPREVGAAMLVWPGGQSGTIGGGALEFQAAAQGRAMLAGGGAPQVTRHALGPALGQCCGGAVTLVTEVFGAVPDGPIVARSLDGAPMPLAVRRVLAAARGQGVVPALTMVQGWLVEPCLQPQRQLWLWGAGHVGRALVSVLTALPEFAITWVDMSPDRFPDAPMAPNLRRLPVPNPALAVALAPADAEHLILTFSHALDLDLCHRLLTHGFARCGLIGSASKWARFRARLAALGHGAEDIARITCPIGDPTAGKHPQAIALTTAAALLSRPRLAEASRIKAAQL